VNGVTEVALYSPVNAGFFEAMHGIGRTSR